MNLIEIDNVVINTDKVLGLEGFTKYHTRIFLMCDKTITVEKNVKEVKRLLEGRR